MHYTSKIGCNRENIVWSNLNFKVFSTNLHSQQTRQVGVWEIAWAVMSPTYHRGVACTPLPVWLPGSILDMIFLISSPMICVIFQNSVISQSHQLLPHTFKRYPTDRITRRRKQNFAEIAKSVHFRSPKMELWAPKWRPLLHANIRAPKFDTLHFLGCFSLSTDSKIETQCRG